MTTSKTTYSISMFSNGQFCMTSDFFSKKSDAQAFFDYITNIDPFSIEFSLIESKETQTSYINSEACYGEEFPTYENQDLSNMTLEVYGKGYMLYPSDDDERYGSKYFIDGWWNAKACGWFFKKEFLDNLLDAGVSFEDSTDELNEDILGMTFGDYGKGYVLYCDESDSRYGEKYFLNGWWNNNAGGWFFKPEFYQDLIDAGALYVTDENDDDFSDEDLTGMTYRKYGKGYLLKPKKSDARFGEKYFLYGWWLANAKGWFFKKEFKQFLRDSAAKYKKTKSNECKDMSLSRKDTAKAVSYLVKEHETFQEKQKSPTLSRKDVAVRTSTLVKQDRQFRKKKLRSSSGSSAETDELVFEKYGRGWIVRPDKNHPNYGEKYFHNGWWMPAQNGWFFRTQAKKAYEKNL